MRTRSLSTILLLLAIPTIAQDAYEVDLLDLRPSSADFAPVPLDSGFVMCSIREGTGVIDHRMAGTDEPLADLYWVPLTSAEPGKPVLFSATLTTPVHEGPAAFTDQGRTIWFTRNIAIPKRLGNLRHGDGQLGLFHSTRQIDGTWQAPIPFAVNSDRYSTVHPAFSRSGDTLIFASDMPGGWGGMDLYLCIRRASGWSTPVNMGPGVNSGSHDAFPVVQPNGDLVFSSDRTGGHGKFDLYRITMAPALTRKPICLPAPLNSPGNDMGYSEHLHHPHALFSSDRTGTDRIHLARRTITRFTDCEPQARNNPCYAFRTRPHAATMNLPVDHVWDMGDGTRIKGTLARHCYEHPGRFRISSMLVDRSSGEVFHVLRTLEHEVLEHEQAYISGPDTVRTGRPFHLDAHASHVPSISIAEYHWDLGDGDQREGERIEHVYPTAGQYTVRLEVVGPTADGGTQGHRCNTRTIVVLDRFNDRPDAAIAATYQDAEGAFGGFEFQELPFDEFGMGMDERGEGTYSVELFASRERVSLDDVRFIEVSKLYRVIERFDPVRGLYTYSVGEAGTLEELYEVYRKVKELQFLDAEVFALQVETLIDMSELDLASIEELNNAKVRTNAVHFSFRSAELEDPADPVLMQMIDLLRQHPQLMLVIEAHTDDVGSGTYNMELSEQRAQAVMQHLVRNGIDPARLMPIGHGKNHPIADNNSEEGRGQNRRVEFRMALPEGDHAFQRTR